MISPRYVRMMARYNHWQNQSIYAAADTLPAALRRQDRGAFFRSIEGTLNHILWGDMMWMHRFAGTPRPTGGIPQSPERVADWELLKAERVSFDQTIIEWADRLMEKGLDGNLTWFSGALGVEVTRPLAMLVVHFFNHQTHHRGQVHAMLTAAGAKPEDTDLMILPGIDEI
jgi:uncharacterized damage-inducible protein DinB